MKKGRIAMLKRIALIAALSFASPAFAATTSIQLDDLAAKIEAATAVDHNNDIAAWNLLKEPVLTYAKRTHQSKRRSQLRNQHRSRIERSTSAAALLDVQPAGTDRQATGRQFGEQVLRLRVQLLEGLPREHLSGLRPAMGERRAEPGQQGERCHGRGAAGMGLRPSRERTMMHHI
jgi:hypothetical protein